MSQLDISFGKKLRDAGMKQAEDHANEYWGDNWSQRAYEKLLLFLETKSEPFPAEEFREFADKNGLDSPPSLRAFGAIITRAAREEKIKKVGYTQVSNARAHRANVSVWIKN